MHLLVSGRIGVQPWFAFGFYFIKLQNKGILRRDIESFSLESIYYGKNTDYRKRWKISYMFLALREELLKKETRWSLCFSELCL